MERAARNVSPADVIKTAAEWRGVIFRHQGRTRHGVDCVGLIICVGHELGIIDRHIDRRDYGRTPAHNELEKKLSVYCERLPELRPGCVAAIQWRSEIAHVGIYTGSTLIHAYEAAGRVVEHGLRGRWQRLVRSAWALPRVGYGQ